MTSNAIAAKSIMYKFIYSYSTVKPYSVEGEKLPFLFFELKVSYCFNPNTYEFNEELINWDYKGFRLGFEENYLLSYI